MELKVNLERCYGIKKLNHTFEFLDNDSTFSIYASNATMKTSFAKTFDDISKSVKPRDLIFSERITICKIEVNQKDIEPSQVFVIHSYREGYESEKLSTLLANKELRRKYKDVYKEIDKEKEIFLKKLKTFCGVSKLDDIEKKYQKFFTTKMMINFLNL